MQSSRIRSAAAFLLGALGLFATQAGGQGIIADHTRTNLNAVPAAAIQQAKQNLHIAYGHTSHGSQISEGMDGLVAFMNAKPADAFPDNLFTFNNGGTGGALDYRDFYGNFGGLGLADDLGAPNRTAWAAATRTYLQAHPEVNVIMWSWCGQVDGTQAEIQQYLTLMSGLETEFPAVRFVYMTGHLNGGGATGNVNVRNNQIRDFCRTNNKVLFDFADIESYDPDGLVNYMALLANDNCDYDSDGNGSRDRNWATVWQNSHVQNTDWYNCGSAHSQPLNANRKAYAIWWLFARLAGWTPVTDLTPPSNPSALTAPTVAYNRVELSWNGSSDTESGVSGYRIYRNGTLRTFVGGTTFADTTVAAATSYTYTVRAVNGSLLESGDSNSLPVTTPAAVDTQAPTTPGNLRTDSVTTTAVALRWNASTDNVAVTSYRIYRGAAQIGTATGLTYTDSGLNQATSYTYRVTALDAAGNESSASSALDVTTVDPGDTTAPTIPTGLQSGGATTTSVQLTWNPATDDRSVTGYRIYRNGTAVGTSATTSFGDTGLTADTSYAYRVSAYDAAGNESALSAQITARTLDPSQVQHTIRLQGAAQSADAFIAASAPTTNYGGTSYVSTIDRFLVRFDLPAALNGRRVVSAQVAFYVWSQSNYQPEQYLELYRVTASWVEAAVTWNQASAGTPWTTAGGDRAERVGRILQLSGSANWDHVFYPPVDVTLLVQKWAAGTVPNHGLMMVHSPVTGIGLKASEYGTSSAPYLEITYTEEAAPLLYELWLHGPFTDAELADTAAEPTLWGRPADPDGDGMANLIEYALGTDPRTANPGGLGGVLRSPAMAEGLFELSFRRRPGVSGVAYELERSADLSTWATVDAGDITEDAADCGCGLEEVTWRIVPTPGQPRGFYRLRVRAE
ncbi:MAG TPA: DNRLRE domain-containing protein [Opitutaceae bacterium]|nr:DNRLRE domain-containing protein [Opitutaceae bacterium]